MTTEEERPTLLKAKSSAPPGKLTPLPPPPAPSPVGLSVLQQRMSDLNISNPKHKSKNVITYLTKMAWCPTVLGGDEYSGTTAA